MYNLRDRTIYNYMYSKIFGYCCILLKFAEMLSLILNNFQFCCFFFLIFLGGVINNRANNCINMHSGYTLCFSYISYDAINIHICYILQVILWKTKAHFPLWFIIKLTFQFCIMPGFIIVCDYVYLNCWADFQYSLNLILLVLNLTNQVFITS